MAGEDTPRVHKRFLSTERDHIVQVMEKLAHALPPDMLGNPQEPLVVSVKGARCIGKSLIPCVFREALLGTAPQLEGRAEFDERWKGIHKSGQPLEIGFVNLVWPFMDMSDSLQARYPQDQIRPSKQDVADAYLSQRVHGGITFISHAEAAEKVKPGMVIEMLYESLPKHLPEEKQLSQKFFKAMCDNSLSPWLRIVKMDVSDPRLLQSETFMQTFTSLRAVYNSPPRENHPVAAVPAVRPRVWGK